MSRAAEIEAELERVETLIKSVTDSPRPSYMVDGIQVHHAEYLRTLLEYRKQLREDISKISFQAKSTARFER